MGMKKFIVFILMTNVWLLSQCNLSKTTGVNISIEPHEMLSEYGFFVGPLAALNPVEKVLPYDLNSALFSDYTLKSRFVWMPEDASVEYSEEHVLKFPAGTVLIKNFFYNNDDRDTSAGRQIIETRLLINRGEEWEALGYIWNEDQSDATYELVGDIKQVNWVDGAGKKREVDYIIPNRNQCKNCHDYDNKLLPIGPKIRNLNKAYTYSDGVANQLDKWTEIGYLKGYISSPTTPSVAEWDNADDYSLHERAMAYLDINCGHCHNPKGAGNTSGLTLLADSPLGLKLGIYKATVSAGAGTGGHTYSIVPGHPETSIMVYRMNSDNPGAMMPELGRRLIHEEGVELISDWIAGMEEVEGE